MVKVFRVPKLGLTMDQVTVNRWLKEPGDAVRAGDPFVVVETDKAELDVEATEDGYLRQQAASPGEAVPVGAPLAVFTTSPDESVPAGVAGKEGEPASLPPQAPSPRTSTPDDPRTARYRASPAVRRRARELGIDLAAVAGSGPSGRIRLRDLDVPHPESASSAAAPAMERGVLSRVRRVSAQRMVDSARTIPQFTLRQTVDVSNLEQLLSTLRSSFSTGVSITDFIVSACAAAMMEHPLLRSELQEPLSEGVYLVHPHADIALAVDTPEGIVAPVIGQADALALASLAGERRQAVAAAMAGRLPSRFAGRSTFTVSNLGPFGVDEFHALVTPGDAAVVAVGAMRKTPRLEPGGVIERTVLTLTFTFDHRLVDGAEGARFAQAVVSRMQGDSWQLV